MSLLSLIAAFLLEQLRPHGRRRVAPMWFARYANMLAKHYNAGEQQQGVIAWFLAVTPWVVISLGVYYLALGIHPVLAWLWNVVVLYFTMGFRRFSHFFSGIAEALQAGELAQARELLAEWRVESTGEYSGSEIAKVAIEEGLVSTHRNVFGVIFWFLILPGPAGAILYRTAANLYARWGHRVDDEFRAFGQFARRTFTLIDWVPSRATAMTFALAGDFEDAIECWRSQAVAWARADEGIVLASGAGALGVRLGETLHHHGTVSFRPELGLGVEADAASMASAAAMIWRGVLIWLTMLTLATIAVVF
jgi:cobalamin biosynthesis protein CobD/CbiB